MGDIQMNVKENTKSNDDLQEIIACYVMLGIEIGAKTKTINKVSKTRSSFYLNLGGSSWSLGFPCDSSSPVNIDYPLEKQLWQEYSIGMVKASIKTLDKFDAKVLKKELLSKENLANTIKLIKDTIGYYFEDVNDLLSPSVMKININEILSSDIISTNIPLMMQKIEEILFTKWKEEVLVRITVRTDFTNNLIDCSYKKIMLKCFSSETDKVRKTKDIEHLLNVRRIPELKAIRHYYAYCFQKEVDDVIQENKLIRKKTHKEVRKATAKFIDIFVNDKTFNRIDEINRMFNIDMRKIKEMLHDVYGEGIL